MHEHEGVTNRILLGLPPETLKRLRPAFEPLDLPRGRTIDQIDRPIEFFYFVNRGLVSVIKTMRDGRTVEVGAIGPEGVTDPYALFGIDRAIHETIVQVPGTAFRIARDTLRDGMAEDDALRQLLHRYARFAFGQVAQTGACNRLHSLEERCCRWLLIAHDGALSDTYSLTHEFLAMMLGVQRAGVSIAANMLKKAGLIEYTHGRVTITDRSGLEDGACECYATTRSELEKVFGAGKSA
jgi:CRP-like cAMP-binding protein